jgi:hypothetical protein
MSNNPKWFRVRVTDIVTGKNKTNVKIPARMANFGMRMAAKYAPESIEGLDMEMIMEAVKNGGEGMLVEVEDEEKRERVEVFLE